LRCVQRLQYCARVTQPAWTPHRAIADRVRTLRQGRGWSAAKLAEQMKVHGISWDRSIVANFESGRRAYVTVEELLALAYVLDVAPVHLLIPTETEADDQYAPVPTFTTHPSYVREWIRGLRPIGDVDLRRYFSDVPAAAPTRSGTTR
jgi:transcriptional regulator with XRE-family HTH domain